MRRASRDAGSGRLPRPGRSQSPGRPPLPTDLLPTMRPALLIKIALWLILIGAAAQLTPQPAWPSWLAQAVFWAGVALGLGTLLVAAWRADRARKHRDRGPD